MLIAFVSGLAAGVVSGVLFAVGFSWQLLGQYEDSPGIFTSFVWLVPVVYGSVFSFSYAFAAAGSVVAILPLSSQLISKPKVSHTLTSCLVLCVAYYLWRSPTPSHATMIQFGSYRGCCFLSAALVTQISLWKSHKSRTSCENP